MAKLSAILAALAGGLLWLLRGAWKKTAQTEAENAAIKEQEKARTNAEKAIANERDETADSDDAAIRERLRERDRLRRGM